MGFTIVLGLAVLCVANYGNTFEFSKFHPFAQGKTQLKPTIKPFSSQFNLPQHGDQAKSASSVKTVVTPKPFGSSPFDPFKQPYQPYQQYQQYQPYQQLQPIQPPSFRANYQPFGPYPGYQGPVVYPGQGSFPGPAAYPQPSYTNNNPFGFQARAQTPFQAPAQTPFQAPAQAPFQAPFQVPAQAPVQPSFGSFKFGAPKKFNKNLPGLADFNQPGKFFQEHQFGAYHGPEFSSAIVPADHNLKQSKPKDTLLNKAAIPPVPAIPSYHELGLPKPGVYGFAPQPSFGYPAPNFPQFQPFASTLPSLKSAPTTPAFPALPSFTVPQLGSYPFTSTSSPVSVSSADETATARSSEVTSSEPSVTPVADPQPTVGPSQEEVIATTAGGAVSAETEAPINNEVPVAADDTATQQPASEPVAVQASTEKEPFSPVVVPEIESSTAAAAAVQKSEDNKPTESTNGVNSLGLPSQLFGAPVGNVPISDQQTLNLFGSSGFPYFGQFTGLQQPSYEPSYVPSYFDAPKFTDDQLKSLAANFGTNFPQGLGGIPDAKISEGVSVSTESSVPVSSTSSSAESGAKAENVEQKESSQPESPESRFIPSEPNQFSTVSLFQNDPFSGQLPLLSGPAYTQSFSQSYSASPLNTYRFFGLPSGVPVSSTPSADTVEVVSGKAESSEKAEGAAEKVEGATEKAESGEKNESAKSEVPEEPKKSNTVQIVPNESFNGQFPQLFDPSSISGSSLDAFRFYSQPSSVSQLPSTVSQFPSSVSQFRSSVSQFPSSVSQLPSSVSQLPPSQASPATYSPEEAFKSIGSQFRSSYLAQGPSTLSQYPQLSALPKTTIVQSDNLPLSISSPDHPLHSQVFKYAQSFVPYPSAAAGPDAPAFRSFEQRLITVPGLTESSTEVVSTEAAPAKAAEEVVASTSTTAARRIRNHRVDLTRQ